MSLILDALNKADRERHEGDAPDLRTQHEQIPPTTPRHNYPVISLTALCSLLGVVAVGLFIWALSGSQRTSQEALPKQPRVEQKQLGVKQKQPGTEQNPPAPIAMNRPSQLAKRASETITEPDSSVMIPAARPDNAATVNRPGSKYSQLT